jgi:nitrile hydratase beta subunit-like protein
VTFVAGDPVLVADRPHEGHHRTPGYLKGVRGRIARVHDTFRNPETRAYGEDGLPELRLYLVEFAGADVWSSSTRRDRIYADLFEHWLEPTS